MLVLKIGEPFPMHNKANGQEYCRIEIFENTDYVFELFYYFDNPNQSYKNAWSKKEFKHGVYKSNHIPFVLFQFDVNGALWQFDVTINVHTLTNEFVDLWLNSESKLVRMYLINARTNILESMAIAGLNKEIADEIRNICENQDAQYNSKEDVEQMTRKIEKTITTSEMVMRTKMYRA